MDTFVSVCDSCVSKVCKERTFNNIVVFWSFKYIKIGQRIVIIVDVTDELLVNLENSN